MALPESGGGYSPLARTPMEAVLGVTASMRNNLNSHSLEDKS